jgi:fucose permease
MFVFGVILLLMGSLLPSLPVSYAQAGGLGSFPLLGILLATILVGPVLDTVGPKYVIIVALALISGALATMPSLPAYRELAAAAFVYGFGGGLVNTAANALVANLSASARAAALNVLGFSFSLGAFSAPLAMSTFAGALSSATWLRLLALVSVLVLATVLALPFPPPSQAGTRITSLLALLKSPMIWLFGALLFFESASENCMFVWAAKIVGDFLHTGAKQANLVLVGLSGALGIGRLIAVLWIKWLGSRGTVLLSTTIVCAGVLLVCLSREFAVIVAGMVVIGLGLSAIFPTVLGIAGDFFPNETGTAFGAIITVALIGGSSGPALAALLAVHGPLDVLWIPAVSAIVVAGLTVVLGKLELRRRTAE